MRIAVYHNLPSGGAKRTLYEATRRLSQRHEVDVYTLSSADHAFCDLRPHAAAHRVYPFQPGPTLASPWGRANQAIRIYDLHRLRALTRRIARDIDAGGYDVALVHPCRFETAPSLLRFLQRTPSVYYCQEPPRRLYEPMPVRPYDDGASLRRRWLNRIDPLPAAYHARLKRADWEHTRRADRVLVNSRFMQEAVQRIYDIRAHVSYHGIDPARFRPLGLEREAFVLSVGSLTPLKGFDFLIQALAQLPQQERLPLVIASNFQNPPERAYLEGLAQELGVDVRFQGHVSDDDLLALYNRARAVLYAPIREPFGLVPLEAMACETPVVAVAEGGVRESVVHEVTGLLTPREPQAFAQALAWLLAHPEDARVFGQQGRAQVLRRWTWDQAVATLETHLYAVEARASAHVAA
jgi:glycosyltransferase involved in cell wall biosynthesis